jgi:hypothetical protein
MTFLLFMLVMLLGRFLMKSTTTFGRRSANRLLRAPTAVTAGVD